MEVQTIEKLEQLITQNRTVEIDGQTFSERKMEPVFYTPRAQTLRIRSLLGFCDYIKSEFDGVKKESVMVIVDDVDSVRLVSKLYGKDRNRECLIEAMLSGVDTFAFGDFMTQEAFAIQFRSLFVPNEENDTNYVLSFVSKLRGGTAISTEDDGITQQVGVTRGISGNLTAKERAKPIVKLAPYRTFREIEQPESEFLLRTRMDSNNIPLIALFEADGGAWRISAMKRIAEYISAACGDIQILA